MKEKSNVKTLAKKLGLYNIANTDYEFPKPIPKKDTMIILFKLILEGIFQ